MYVYVGYDIARYYKIHDTIKQKIRQDTVGCKMRQDKVYDRDKIRIDKVPDKGIRLWHITIFKIQYKAK